MKKQLTQDEIIAKMKRTRLSFDINYICVANDDPSGIVEAFFVLSSPFNPVGWDYQSIKQKEEKEIARRLKARENRRNFREVVEDLGMNIVRGPISGKRYIE